MGDHRAATGWTLPVRTRAYLYRVSLPLLALLAAYGVISADRLPLWIALAGALFTTSLAAVNTSTRKEDA